MNSPLEGGDFALGIVVGAAAALVLGAAVFAAVLRASDMHSLGHWKLNLRTPLASIWMNLGYWKTADGQPVRHIDEACLGLLREIVKTAGVLSETRAGPPAPVAVLDLGFGCGDQTLALARLVQPPSWRDFRYVGLTLNESQLPTASRTLNRELAASAGDMAPPRASFRLFRANAARPDSWSPAIRDAVQGLADAEFPERWLLALDCLYHFFPLRRPIFRYVAQELAAGVMAFDLVLNDKASWRDTLLVRLVGLVMSCPLYTFLTEDQYKAQLVEYGYDRPDCHARRLGPCVCRHRELPAAAGGGAEPVRHIGGFKLAGRLFDWFDRSSVVRAVIVVSRTKGKSAS